MVAIPLATRHADRHDALRMAIVIAAAGAVVGYGVVGIAQGAATIAAAFVFASMFYTPIMPLADAYALRGLARVGRAYGPVRMWGSAAFIAGSFGAGVLLDVAPARDLIWLIVAAAAITAAAACVLKLPPHGSARAAELSSASGIWRDPAFLAMAAAASLIQASHAVFTASPPSTGGQADDGAATGPSALGVAAEIVLFAISGRLRSRRRRCAGGRTGAVMRWARWHSILPPSCRRRCNACTRCRLARPISARSASSRARYRPRSAPPPRATSPPLGLAMAASMALAAPTRAGSLAYGAMAVLAAPAAFAPSPLAGWHREAFECRWVGPLRRTSGRGSSSRVHRRVRGRSETSCAERDRRAAIQLRTCSG
jgi:hypothetical protein